MNPQGYRKSYVFYLPTYEKKTFGEILNQANKEFVPALVEARDLLGLTNQAEVWLESNGVIHTKKETVIEPQRPPTGVLRIS